MPPPRRRISKVEILSCLDEAEIISFYEILDIKEFEELLTFPHHKHISGKISESYNIECGEILQEISTHIRKKNIS